MKYYRVRVHYVEHGQPKAFFSNVYASSAADASEILADRIGESKYMVIFAANDHDRVLIPRDSITQVQVINNG